MLNLELDQYNMYDDLKNYSNQIKQTLSDLEKFKSNIEGVEKIVFCGMGGSAIGGDLVKACFEKELKIPMIIRRDYELPEFVDEDTLVVVCSFSGNTEETLQCFESAKSIGAKILTLSSGGKLEKECIENKFSFFKLEYKSECGQPRVNSGVMLTAVAGILSKLNLIKLEKDAWEKIIEQIENNFSDWGIKNEDEEANLALIISQALQNKIPVFHGAGFLSTVARRFKQDINETGKQLAFYEEVPESNHNAVVGYEFPKAKSDVVMVEISSELDSPRNSLRWNILEQVWDKRELNWVGIDAQGETRLEQIFFLTQLGMFTAFYLALLNGIDPTSVEIIKFIKDELAKS